MRVLKRNGESESVSFDKVLNRIANLATDLTIDTTEIAQKVCSRIYDGVNTGELDELAAQLCSSMVIDHPDYGTLASRLIISNHQKNTSPSFSETISNLYNNTDIHEKINSLVSDDIYNIVMANKDKLNHIIKYDRDYNLDYFGFKTLERSYLLRINGKVIERPQHLFMRVSLGIHGKDFKDALETYEYLSQQYFVHATPTLFNAGTNKANLSSCFLLDVEDSVEGMYDLAKECALISKCAGGIGINIHDIRAKGSNVRGSNGKSSGIIPMLRVFNSLSRHIDQGGKRNGSIACYIEPYHADIMEFLDLRKNHGNEEERCRDLFLALWIPDLFMKRVQENGVWSLMCPDECRGLTSVYGDEFEELYTKYEKEGKFRKQIKAQDVWQKIIESQIETGTPYMLYKDAVNKKNNQCNLGSIKSSNLCAEITLFTDYKEEIAVCNLGSICLPKYINADDNTYNHTELHKIAKILTKNLNKVIDANYYPLEKARTSNMRNRPIGIGIQGWADVCALLKLPFESKEAKKLNKEIFETIYHGALEASMEIAKKRKEWYETSSYNETYMDKWENNKELQKTKFPMTNAINLRLTKEEKEKLPKEYIGAYSSFVGSPVSEGKLQFDLWGVTPDSGRYDWSILKAEIKKHGIRNSMLLACMPTASTSQICGYNESFEAFNSNIYKRRTLSGEFVMVNKYLRKDLMDLNLWNVDMKEQILINEGSIQNIKEIPDDIKELYKTVWEIKQKAVIDQSIDRAPYICQTQSLNLFFEEPEYKKLTSAAFYAWGQGRLDRGLKTGSYYIRSKPKAKTQAFTIDPTKSKTYVEQNKIKEIVEEDTECLSCGS
jgi:ribonucleoside-diphosphate reductase alpha subunit